MKSESIPFPFTLSTLLDTFPSQNSQNIHFTERKRLEEQDSVCSYLVCFDTCHVSFAKGF
jgi:hypothetical protein